MESADPSIATFIQDAPGAFEIHIQGVAEGETGLVFRLMHGTMGSGHADFTTEPLEVHVHAHDDDDEEEEEGEVEGVVLVMGTDTVATFDGHDQMWSDTLEVAAGADTGHIDVHFVDHDGHALEFGEDYYLEVESGDTGIATVSQDETGAFEIHVQGVAQGETGLEFRLMHGTMGSGHADFTTDPPLPVRVTAP